MPSPGTTANRPSSALRRSKAGRSDAEYNRCVSTARGAPVPARDVAGIFPITDLQRPIPLSVMATNQADGGAINQAAS